MKINLSLAVLSTVLVGLAATTPTPGHAEKYVITAIPAKIAVKLAVTSPSYKDGADIPFEHTQYRGNIFPGVTWSKGPVGTQSYVVIMQGGLGGVGEAVSGTSIHFTLMNVPASVTSLATGLTTPPAGAVYGVNVHGDNQQFAGPHTHGFTKHEYHLQVFALDTVLANDPKMSFETLEAGMTGHVLQSGEIVGLAAMDPDSPEAAQLKAAPKK